ncbi:3-oxoacyl-[acyl-carrier-protein] synthase III C-terminal domain-containing protein [Plantactinospora sp. B6F1]|uniref:3-oxoacyl-[acyl-carrier-protein] synthase III C-terminal domain-containing protein n=1 Tax=Plantactinospora sp. B6F1 TaxID=3158971 RepID=UPI00102C6EF0
MPIEPGAPARAGIVDVEVAFPEGRITVDQLHESSGVSLPEILEITHGKEFPVLAPEEQAWELAVDAASTILDRTGTDPATVGKVIYAGSGCWDMPFWSPAAKVADELGITGAHCFEVVNFCNALMTGLGIAAGGIAPGGDERALVVVGERFSGVVDRADPDSKGLFNFGDAAAALLVGGSGHSFGYLASSAHTDPSWCDHYGGEYHDGGIRLRRRGNRKGLAEAYTDNYVALVEQTLERAGRRLADVRYLLVNQNDRNVQHRLLKALDLSPDRSVFNHSELGHMGCADTAIALRQVWDRAALDDGDLVLLAASGMGFSWSVTALEYRAG